MLPPSTNHQYTASLYPVWFLGFMALTTIVPGLIHTFLPDGGAGVIAGRDLSVNGAAIIQLFAWAGATQIVWGLLLLLIVVRYRSFVSLALGLLLLERIIHTINFWGPKGAYLGNQHPPEHYITLVLLPLLALFFSLALRQRIAD